MVGAIFVVNARSGAYLIYYNYNSRLDHVVDSLLFRLSKIIDALKYFGLYKFTHGMGTDLILKVMEIYCFHAVDW